ncbi:polymorphic toxin-type HINT domain-containing protein [Pendulispora albinea]|uniref:polymorphic toxin-type HINT domain-containing protein n=1 Tax=Pendulispora albinea TaxID=2741071 RepID=UPI00374E0635
MTLFRDRRGVSAVEYVLLLVGILLAVAMGFRALGGNTTKVTSTTTAVLLGGNGTAAGGGGGASPGGGGGAGPSDPGTVCSGGVCTTPGGSCFVAGTMVATPSGERPIESIAPGDLVLARGEFGDDAVSARPVLRTFVRAAPSLVNVRIETVDGHHESIVSTPEHPYWTFDRGWVNAGDLVAQETLVDTSGREVRVTRTVRVAQQAIVYNLEVDADHTYFVGQSAVWVHNQPCTPGGGGGTTGGGGGTTGGGGGTTGGGPTTGPVTGPVTGGGTPTTPPTVAPWRNPDGSNKWGLPDFGPITKTDPGKAFFWSGNTDGVGGELKAGEIAHKYGGETLESTLDKHNIKDKMPKWGEPGAEGPWTEVSQSYAANASGKVYVVLGENRRPGNIWDNEELPRLQNNPNITEIIAINPKTGKETPYWKPGMPPGVPPGFERKNP